MIIKWLLTITILPIIGLSYFSLKQFEKALNNELRQSAQKSIDDVNQLIDEKKEALIENSKNYQSNLRLVQSLYYSNIKSSLELASEYYKDQNLTSLSFFNKSGALLVNISNSGGTQSTYVADVNNPIYLSETTFKKIKAAQYLQTFESHSKKLSLILTSPVSNSDQEVIGFIEQEYDITDKDFHKIFKDSDSYIGILSSDKKIFLATHDDLYLLEDSFLKNLSEKKYIPDYVMRGESYLVQLSEAELLNKDFNIFVARDKKNSNLILKKIKITFLTVMSFVILLTGFLVIFGKKELNKKIAELQNANNEIKQAQSQLVLSAKMASLGQLVAGVAHELNNPISFIYSNMGELKNYSEKIIPHIDKEVIKSDEFNYIIQDLPKLIKSCEDGSLRIKNIVQNLQSFSRTNANDFKSTNIHDCIDTTINILNSEHKGRVEIVKIYSDLPKVFCNPGQINQVFMNILGNAFHAIKNNGTVTVKTTNLKNQIEIKISDSGEGINPENLAKIFDPFFTTKPVGDGTGLGLSISYNIIQQHRGKIDVQSKLGVGTEFIIQLPI